MKKLVIPFLMLGSSVTYAGDYGSYGRVIENMPVYEDRWVVETVPVNTCEYRSNTRQSNQPNLGRIIVGGLIGSAVGNQISGEPGMGTLGALIGGSMASSDDGSYRERVCRTHYEERERRVSSLSHYNVTVTHRGRLITVQSANQRRIGSKIYLGSQHRFGKKYY